MFTLKVYVYYMMVADKVLLSFYLSGDASLP